MVKFLETWQKPPQGLARELGLCRNQLCKSKEKLKRGDLMIINEFINRRTTKRQSCAKKVTFDLLTVMSGLPRVASFSAVQKLLIN